MYVLSEEMLMHNVEQVECERKYVPHRKQH